MPSFYQLEFERDVAELDRRIDEAGRAPAEEIPALGGVSAEGASPDADVAALTTERDRLLREVYGRLDAWDTVRVSRHPNRPQGRDHIQHAVRDFCELHGDRRFGDDPAIVTGLGRIGAHKCMIVAHHKGRDTAEKLRCHFGCAHPEGYRKALLKMKLAEKLGLPVVALVDTPGAYPGIGAEQRGQAEAIAVNLREMRRLRVPIVSVVIGEGGSGGALGIAVADRVAMMRHAWYSVISPEGCAAILWKEANDATNRAAAEALKPTAADNLRLGVVDAVIEEPLGGAHRDPAGAAAALAAWVSAQLDELKGVTPDRLVADRFERFRRMGSFELAAEAPADAAAEPENPSERVTRSADDAGAEAARPGEADRAEPATAFAGTTPTGPAADRAEVGRTGADGA